MNDNPSIDESCYRYIIRQYLSHWKQKLLSERISFGSIHGLTASCISLLTEAGVDERIVKKIVGHKGQGVTQIVYTHIDLPCKLEAINLI